MSNGGHDSTFATQARAADTLRWGGRTSLSWGPSSPAGGNNQTQLNSAINRARGKLGSQLVNAHWRWPLSWRTLVCIRPQFAPDETGTVTVRLDWTIGSGDAQQTFSMFYVLSPTAGVGYEDLVDPTLILPAADVQCTLSLGGIFAPDTDTHPISTATVDMLEIGVFVAPYTEPHAGLHMAESAGALVDANRQDGTWMPPGFNPEELGYRR